MRSRFKYLALLLVAILTIVSVSLVLAKGNYDENDNGMVERAEAEAAVRDYFAGEIPQEEALDYFLRHFANVPLGTQAPTRTPVPTSTPIPSPTPGPDGIPSPIPMLDLSLIHI